MSIHGFVDAMRSRRHACSSFVCFPHPAARHTTRVRVRPVQRRRRSGLWTRHLWRWYPISREWRVNHEIRAREVRLIGVNGEQLGVFPLREALRVAEEAELDLVEVAPQSKPPVCRLMDFGRFKYEQSKRDREARKKQKAQTIKEIRMSPKTDRHDIEVKIRNAERFLRDGDRVKVNVRFRGREIVHSDLVRDRLMEMAAALAEVGEIERPPYMEGKQMAMVLAPKKTSGKDSGSRKSAPSPASADGEVMVNAQAQDA